MQTLLRSLGLGLVATVALNVGSTACASAQSSSQRVFDGPFGGLELGLQNVIAGSAVGGRDVLSRDDLVVASLLLGWRKQLGSGVVFGLELQYGRFSADLRQTDAITGADIRYEGDAQLAYGLTLGYALSARQPVLFYAYAYETERDFDVAIEFPTGTVLQSDEQGILRYGIGTELQLKRSWHLRAAIGTTRADFGSAITNFDADGEVELALAVLYSF